MKFLNEFKSAWSEVSSEFSKAQEKSAKEAAEAKARRLAENKHMLHFKEHHLLGGEEIVAWAPAQRMRDLFGVAVLTTKRFVWYRSGMMGQAIEPWPLNKINSTEVKRGLVGYYLKLHTGNDTLHLAVNDKVEAEKLIAALQTALNEINSGLEHELQLEAVPDHIEQLKRLAGLKDAGILTEEEFATKKAELLSRI